MRKLYKCDSKGKLRLWQIYTKGDKLIQESGLVDGKLVENSKVCTSKNVGKSNETTGEEQAKLELDSTYRDKLSEGYVTTQKEAESQEIILPMLALDYKKQSKKIDWSGDVFVQPKLDGMRCLAIIKGGKVTLKSRDGKEIQNMEHIIKELSTIKQDIILDGELYAHGKTFQDNMRLIKKYRKDETEQVQYHIYDIVLDENFQTRNSRLEVYTRAFSSPQMGKRTVVTGVRTTSCSNEKDLKTYHSYNLEEGYEGSIVRHGKKGYELDKRSDSLLKYKDFQDIACEIIDIVPADQRPLWGKPILKYKGKTFSAGMKYSHAEREEFLINKKDYIGKTAEIRYFEESEDGIPRFPVMVGIRLDK